MQVPFLPPYSGRVYIFRFVLYDDNLNPLDQPSSSGSDVSAGGGPESSRVEHEGVPPSGTPHLPAHLEYHDSEKKWREGKPPNRDIILRDCFNIYKKKVMHSMVD